MISLNAVNMEAPDPNLSEIRAFTGVVNGELRFFLMSSDNTQVIELSDSNIYAYDAEDFEFVSEFCEYFKIKPQQYFHNKIDFSLFINVREG